MNVMGRVIRKRKPQKKRVQKKNTVIGNTKLNKNNPIADLDNYDTSLWFSLIRNYIDEIPLGEKTWGRTRVLNFLLYGLPLSMAEKFVKTYIEEGLNLPISSVLDRFIMKPEVARKIKSMTKFIQSRTPEPLKYKKQKQPEINRKKIIYIDETSSPESGTRRPGAERRFGKGEILSNCEREYGRAPWMAQFTNKIIRGFVIFTGEPNEYTSSLYKNGWFRVNMLWYKHACEKNENTRKFPVAYLTMNGEMIDEKPEMYQASLISWETQKNVEFSNVYIPESFDVAKQMLTKSIIPAEDINAVLSSLIPASGSTFPSATNHDVAKRLSWVLVFLQKLITEPQVHHSRVKNRQYDPDLLAELDRYALLPEIYKDPSKDNEEIDEIIRKKRNFIEQDFYDRLTKLINPTLRKSGTPRRPNFYAPLKTFVREKCPPGVNDVVYYEDEQELFCFERQAIINTRYNPVTGKPWKSTFVEELKRIQNPILIKPLQSVSEQSPEPRDIVAEKELAPGLFSKLRAEITLLQTYICDQCDREILVPRYKSIKNGKKVLFCTQDCFDDYNF
jgi:hypothetical protein